MSKAYRFEVIPHMVWKHALTGAQASIYGASPQGDDWSIVEDGFTFRDNRYNTVGSYGVRDRRTVEEIEGYLTTQYGFDWRLQHAQ
jgi:hypothetical protein